jgi:hypothetical protein
MTIIFTLVVLGVAYVFFMLIYKYFTGRKMVATEDMYQQRDVTVDYKAGTITIKKYVYKVNQVTGISRLTTTNGRRKDHFAEIAVDDMQKPVHKIPVIGSQHSADEFVQRICVAIRKAGGPDFH